MGDMTGDQIARFAYLALLGAAIAGWFFAQNRESLGKTLQQAAIWLFLFIGTIAAAGLWMDIKGDIAPRQSVLADGTIEVPRAEDGHYYLTLQINGKDVRFVVDTGATEMVLSRSDAARLGFDPDGLAYLGNAYTANGVVRTAQVRLDSVALGPITDYGVRALVNDGDLFGSLLGMGYLNRFDRLVFEDGVMLLER